MVEFKIVSTPRPDRFEEFVNALLNDGWAIQGSPFISGVGGMTIALTRETKAKTNAKVKSKI
jgi:hypothetical protein